MSEKSCEYCKHWVPLNSAIGNCTADFETKMAHQSCSWFERKVKE